MVFEFESRRGSRRVDPQLTLKDLQARQPPRAGKLLRFALGVRDVGQEEEDHAKVVQYEHQSREKLTELPAKLSHTEAALSDAELREILLFPWRYMHRNFGPHCKSMH